MSTLNQIREGLGRAWDTLTVGWRELRELAGDALTRFQPKTSAGEVETREERLVHRAARWGLLAAEVSDDDGQVRVMLEVPGLEPGDFSVEVVGEVLVVRGEKRIEREERNGHFHLMERAYGQFERAISLPAAVDENGATATYRRGVLTVVLPKRDGSSAHKITVQSH